MWADEAFFERFGTLFMVIAILLLCALVAVPRIQAVLQSLQQIGG